MSKSALICLFMLLSTLVLVAAEDDDYDNDEDYPAEGYQVDGDEDPAQSLHDCVEGCEDTCGDVGITSATINTLTTCRAKCEACRDLCIATEFPGKKTPEGAKPWLCGNWCAPIRLTEDIAFSKTKMAQKCRDSSVPEHHLLHQDD